MKNFLLIALFISLFQIGVKAQVSFTADVTEGCAPLAVTFTNTSSDGATFQWQYGDGGYYYGIDSSYVFTNTGYYNVYLYAYDDLGYYIGEYYQSIYVMGANDYFYTSLNEACPNTEIYFDPSNYDVYSTFWNFGDGNTSDEYYPYHAYNSSGDYIVSLVLETPCGFDTIYRTISILNDLPFTYGEAGAYDYEVCPNTEIGFYANSNEAQSFSWNFGDGNTSNEQYPYHSYSSFGTYSYSLTMANGCGNDTTFYGEVNISNTVSVNEYAEIYNSPETTCPNQNMQFYSNLDNSHTFLWDFGGGNTFEGQNVNYAFPALGTYTVALTITNSCGNDTIIYKDIEITNSTPVDEYAELYYYPQTACPNQYMSFYSNLDDTHTFLWNFGGTTYSGQNVNFSFPSLGVYTVTLTITNSCGNDTTIYQSVEITNDGSFSTYCEVGTYQNNVCPGSQVTFYANSNDIQSYEWNFGDGSSVSYDSNPNHSYSSLGTYTYSVTLFNSCGNDTTVYGQINITNDVPVYPYVQVYYYPEESCPNQQVQFYTNLDDSYTCVWNINGVTYTENNAYHAFNAIGTYNYSTTITNSCGSDTIIYGSITISNNVPFAGYCEVGTYVNQACPGSTIQFYTNSDQAQSYLWNFGDGTTESENSYPSHSYASIGAYTYSVTLYNSCGSDTTIYGEIDIVNDVPVYPYVQINHNPEESCPNQQVQFYSNVDNTYSFLWNFSDGTTSTESYAYHEFSAPGTYTVSLKLTNSCGSDTTIYTHVNISNDLPFSGNLNVYVENYNVCPNTDMYFQAWAEQGYSYLWNFDDGTTDYDQYVNHSFPEVGTYDVSITIANACGMDTTINLAINVVNDLPIQNLWYNVSAYSACPNDYISFNTDEDYNCVWNFGDGVTSTSNYANHAYSTVGNYTASLKVTNECDVDTTVYFTISVNSGASFSNNIYFYHYPSTGVCPGESVNFQFEGNYESLLDFGDGTTSTNSYEEHSYDAVGTYNVSLTLTNGCGNDTTLYSTVEVSNNNGVNYLWFDMSASTICPNTEVEFWTDDYASYLWNFGDGTTSIIGDPNHTYYENGTYNVTLTVTNFCGHSATSTETIEVENNLDIDDAAIYYSPSTAVCPGSPVNFYAYDDNLGVTYLWDFGDGTTSTEQETTHSFSSVGEYEVTVNIINGCGNTITTSEAISIEGNVIPNANDYEVGIAQENICPNDQAIIYVFPTGNSYSVNFGDGTIETSFQQLETDGTVDIITHTYTTEGNYDITVQVTNACGNSFETELQAYVSSTSTIINGSLQFQESAFVGEEVGFLGAGGHTYLWNFGDGTTTTVTGEAFSTLTRIYQAAGTYQVSLTISNSCGVSETYTGSVVISPAIIELTANITVKNISCFDLTDGEISVSSVTNGTAPYTYLWSNGATTSSITNLSAGFYSVTVTDASSNIDVQYANIVEPNKIQATITTTNASCGTTNGTATVSAIGGTLPYSYQWNTGGNTTTIDSLASGYYFAYVIDANHCLGTAQGTVNDGDGPSISLVSLTNVSCNDGENGSISISVTGGSGAYTYEWSNGATTEDISNLPAGPYEIVVSDVNLCQAVKSFVVTEPAQIQITSGITNADCGSSNGSLVAYVSGGTSPFSFEWSNGTLTALNSGLAAGIYTVTVTDSKACEKQKTTAISENGAPTVVVADVQNIECGDATGGVTISVSGGTSGVYSFAWSSGQTTQNISGVNAGSYSLTVTDSGCNAVVEAEIETNTPEIPQICVVTVDSVLGSNLIVWERPVTTSIESYNVYKESSMAGVYFQIGNVSYDDLSVFVDTFSNPLLRSWRYKISSVDACGGESELSDLHKTIHLTVNQGIGNSVNLIWDEYEGIDYLTYYIYRKTATTDWVAIDSIPSNLSSYTDNTENVQQFFYTIGIKTEDICAPNTLNKTQLGPYSQSISNMDDTGKIDDSVEENVFTNNITLYPNPTNGMITVRIEDKETNDVNIEIFNIQGQSIYSYKEANVSNVKTQIDLSSQAKGIYFVKILKGNKVGVQKVVVK
ncbi:MAG: hypothetical protein A2236_12445 [Bacteroidetes bacterium RIFOXYA2_FULL_33_7]|nr:MAG: hypothetical protein A2236_12445 [Bacteroidetes bacterium RIFOXYA2_FULL_33_7]